MPGPRTKKGSGQFALDGLERVLHEKARLGIMTSLFTHAEGLVFADLRECCSLTDGNLSRHLQILNDAGLIEIWKGFKGKRPQTLCRLTTDGRKRFLNYLGVLESVLKTVEASASEKPRRRVKSPREGWAPA